VHRLTCDRRVLGLARVGDERPDQLGPGVLQRFRWAVPVGVQATSPGRPVSELAGPLRISGQQVSLPEQVRMGSLRQLIAVRVVRQHPVSPVAVRGWLAV
jgi:hypothetical protein